MTSGEFAIALALLLILEGLLPFLSPASLRRALLAIQEISDRQLRVIGLASMCAGIVLLYIVND
ncbi:MAG TPA: DUF2065 domain-containing protein [Anaerolineae bacterium]|uniref:DUF2065 domain-containing protein n=1 Tax=Candidatus Muproteobacteria bacterium RBG_16_62_13 TaxID=1817756 RepID=A0A1F6T2M3_9PROT|nr:MAG: hypothetical protein A2140_00990 [Candidatus Muproteobacteria bacterium RBG_16_62_13]HJW83576.1 DUF2065 domain-containing protein [Anaerolineae bacterium]